MFVIIVLVAVCLELCASSRVSDCVLVVVVVNVFVAVLVFMLVLVWL